MDDERNLVQPYINAYQTKLQKVAGNNITAEIGKYYGNDGVKDFERLRNEDGRFLLTPDENPNYYTENISYWLGSSDTNYDPSYTDYILTVDNNGQINTPSNHSYNTSSLYRIRPIVKIKY